MRKTYSPLVLVLTIFFMVVAGCSNPGLTAATAYVHVNENDVAAEVTEDMTGENLAEELEAISNVVEGVDQIQENSILVGDLRNASYTGIYDEAIILKDGHYEDSPLTVQYVKDTEVFEDLDGDGVDDAIVFLKESGGGTASFLYVAAQLNRNGKPVDAGAAMVEDRTQIRSVDIEDGKLILDIIAHGPGDPDCCATYKTRRFYSLQDGKLVENKNEAQDMVKVTMDDLNGTVWTLIEMIENTPVLAVNKITIKFQDGQYSGSGGCNDYNGIFTLGDPNPFIITMSSIAATTKACPDPVLEQEAFYFKVLQSVTLWGYMNGDLVLAYPDEQSRLPARLLFESSGSSR